MRFSPLRSRTTQPSSPWGPIVTNASRKAHDAPPLLPAQPGDAAARAAEAAARVAAGIANELRNPLFAISSAAQLLRFRAHDDPVVERNIGRILHEVDRMNAIVAELSEYGASHPLHLAPADPDVVWDEVLEGNRALLEGRALALDRTRPARPAKVRADVTLLAQAFAHLLRSAADAAPPGTRLTLQSSVAPGTGWQCTLHDDGPPIPPDALPHLFDLFSPIRAGGSRIGLALAQRIIHQHLGTIAVASAPEHGTTVTVTLPARS